MQAYDDVEEKLEQLFAEEKEKKDASNKGKQTTSVISPKQVTKQKRSAKLSATKKNKRPLLKSGGNSAIAPQNNDNTQATVNQQQKCRGPFIQIKNNRTKIVNFPNNEDEPEKNSSKSRISKKSIDINPVRGMHASTLSSKYDATNTDLTWLCEFCNRGPHKHGLGDLMGPILINDPSAAENIVKSPRKRSEASKNKKIEVWAHEDCVVTSAGVYIIGTKIVGLETAIADSKLHECSVCQIIGATINCTQRGCHLKAHYICAKEQNWSLPDDFRYFCNLHKVTTRDT